MGYLTLNGPSNLRQLNEFAIKMTRDVLKPDNWLTPYFKVFIDIARQGSKHFHSLPVSASYNRALTTAYTESISGAKPPRQALDEVTRVIQTELDQIKPG